MALTLTWYGGDAAPTGAADEVARHGVLIQFRPPRRLDGEQPPKYFNQGLGK